jgi:hypothetical protein
LRATSLQVARNISKVARNFRDVFYCISLVDIPFRVKEAGEDKRISGMFRLIVFTEGVSIQ